MKNIETNINGELNQQDVTSFGGRYNLWERLKKGGIGSPKIIYEEGIEEFDNLQRNIPGEIGFVNFELLKNGLILRLNINQRFSCIGIKLNEIKEINLIGYQIEIKKRRLGNLETKIVHRGELEIVELNKGLKFSIIVGNFDLIKKYFERDEFRRKFNFSISLNPPEKDFGYLFGMLDVFG